MIKVSPKYFTVFGNWYVLEIFAMSLDAEHLVNLDKEYTLDVDDVFSLHKCLILNDISASLGS